MEYNTTEYNTIQYGRKEKSKMDTKERKFIE